MKDEQYKCQSYYDDDNKLRDCTCGKCDKVKKDGFTKEQYNSMVKKAEELGLKITTKFRKGIKNLSVGQIKSNPQCDVLVCELCETDYLENYDEGESISVEEYENLTTEGRCTGCIEEYGTDGYPDR